MVHRALCIPEILSLAFELLVDDRKALSRTARCCKTFSNPALDILWRNLETGNPLRRLLPSQFTANGDLAPGACLPESGCGRFDEYARRVHSASRTWRDWDKIFIQMAHLRPGRSCFPNLRSLNMVEHDASGVPIHAMIPPSLRRLFLLASSPSVDGRSPLQVVPYQAPLLCSLTVMGDLSLTFLHCINQFENLEFLDLSDCCIARRISTLTPGFSDFFRTLAFKAKLAELKLPKTLAIGSIPECVGFAQLTSLHVFNSPAVISKFLQMLSPGALRSLHVGSDSTNGTEKEWRACFAVFCLGRATSLRQIDIAISFMQNNATTVKALHPLLQIRELESVALSSCPWLHANQVQIMVSAWPRLSTLRLGQTMRAAYSWHSLRDISRLFSNLVELEVAIFFENPPAASDLPISSHGLKTLAIVGPLDDETNPLEIARLLDKLFPHLQDICVNNHDDAEIERTIRMFHAIRDECLLGMSSERY